MFSLWEEYCSMVDIVLQLIQAERTGNWDLHLSAVTAMTLLCHGQNKLFKMATRVPYRHASPRMHTSSCTSSIPLRRTFHQLLYSAFLQVATDMALEQSINANSKARGGIIGISQTQSAMDRWFLTIHECASVTTTIKDVYGIKGNDSTAHKEATKARVKR